jgi:hypothetical protein
MNDNGEIGSRTRRFIVSWILAADGPPPQSLTVTPAQ